VAVASLGILIAFAPRASAISRHHLQHALADQMHYVGGASGAYVYNLDAPKNRTLFSWASSTRRILASNNKLFTTAAILDRFGAHGRFTTTAYPRREDGVSGHRIQGNLVLVGAGDPALGTRSFAHRRNLPLTPLRHIAREVRAAGIRRITGGIRADDTVFDRRRGVGATGWHPNVDLSPLSGLSFNSGFDGGHYAKNPELVAARTLKHMLRRLHVRVAKGTGRTDLPASALSNPPLASVASPPLARLVERTNKPSNNFFAEMLLKRLGARTGVKGTTRRGAHRVHKFAHSLGTDLDSVDGSGLSRNDKASPREVGKLLAEMHDTPEKKAYLSSLPLAGHEGTVAGRMRGTAADGRCRTKTGTLTGVSALSGYCRSGKGLVAFSILNNNVDITRAHQAQDKMAALIASYGR
jgi:D-alanyl-D-alanine carboxypeptidase/D-alanyl-D-alanine-endopeptidase (penicillin-binding protein 4)